MDEIVKDEMPGWLGLVGGLLTDCKLDATAVFLRARQYGDEQVKYGHTYGLVNACMICKNISKSVSKSNNVFQSIFFISRRGVIVTVVRIAAD